MLFLLGHGVYSPLNVHVTRSLWAALHQVPRALLSQRKTAPGLNGARCRLSNAGAAEPWQCGREEGLCSATVEPRAGFGAVRTKTGGMCVVSVVESVRNYRCLRVISTFLGRNSVSAMGLLRCPLARVDCGGLHTEGAAKCQEAVGTLGIPPLVSMAPFSPEFSVDIDSCCFVTVVLYGFCSL